MAPIKTTTFRGLDCCLKFTKQQVYSLKKCPCPPPDIQNQFERRCLNWGLWQTEAFGEWELVTKFGHLLIMRTFEPFLFSSLVLCRQMSVYKRAALVFHLEDSLLFILFLFLLFSVWFFACGIYFLFLYVYIFVQVFKKKRKKDELVELKKEIPVLTFCTKLFWEVRKVKLKHFTLKKE